MAQKRTIKPRLVIFFLLTILIVFGSQYYKQQIILNEKNYELEVLNDQITDKVNYNTQLQESINYYQSEEYEEALKQRELDKLNEQIVIFQKNK